jgi:DHA3 family macrolide efflux protein-like MFS transporter
MNPITNGPFLAVVQEVVDPEIQGRVFTTISSVAAAASPIGMAIAGPVADWLGVQVWFILGGLICVLVGVGMFAVPAVMNMEAQGRAVARKLNGDPSVDAQPAE